MPDVSCSWLPRFYRSQGDFGPLFFTDLLQIHKFCRLSLGNLNLQFPLQIL